MQRLDKRGIVGVALLALGVMAMIGGLDSHSSWAADPDRYLSESDRYSDEFDTIELEVLLEEALGGLESLEHLEALEGFSMDMEDFADGLATHIAQAMEHGATRIDRDWPDTVWLHDGRHDVRFDTERFARKMERMARTMERDVIRSIERGSARGERRAHVWRVDDERMDREDIELEMRELQREMRRLERELERLGEEGDI